MRERRRRRRRTARRRPRRGQGESGAQAWFFPPCVRATRDASNCSRAMVCDSLFMLRRQHSAQLWPRGRPYTLAQRLSRGSVSIAPPWPDWICSTLFVYLNRQFITANPYRAVANTLSRTTAAPHQERENRLRQRAMEPRRRQAQQLERRPRRLFPRSERTRARTDDRAAVTPSLPGPPFPTTLDDRRSRNMLSCSSSATRTVRRSGISISRMSPVGGRRPSCSRGARRGGWR